MPLGLHGPGELRRPRGYQGGTLAVRWYLAQATAHASSSLVLVLVLVLVVLVVLVLAEVHPSRWLGLGPGRA